MTAPIDVAALTAWLEGLGVTVPVLDGYFLPPSPDRAYFVTGTGGPGLVMERVFDRVSFQIRSRGGQYQPDDAADLAQQVDDLILGVVPPTTVAGRFVNYVDRLGGPPRFADRDSSFRSEWICQYVLQAAR